MTGSQSACWVLRATLGKSSSDDRFSNWFRIGTGFDVVTGPCATRQICQRPNLFCVQLFAGRVANCGGSYASKFVD
jgi:hypothetical protein